MFKLYDVCTNDYIRISLSCRTVWSIWRSLLEETDKLAKAKLAAVEIFQQQIAEDAKHVRQNKLHIAKKVLTDIISQMNADDDDDDDVDDDLYVN